MVRYSWLFNTTVNIIVLCALCMSRHILPLLLTFGQQILPRGHSTKFTGPVSLCWVFLLQSEIVWSSTGALLEHYWGTTGALLELYWGTTGALLELYWSSTGALLELYWSSTGALLELYWSSTGALLELYWSTVVHR